VREFEVAVGVYKPRNQGAFVAFKAGGVVAFQRFESEYFSVIVGDKHGVFERFGMNGVNLPGGYFAHETSFERKLRAFGNLQVGSSDIPIIALTAPATPEEIENPLASGMNRSLGKPFEPNELARAVAQTLGLENDTDPVFSKKENALPATFAGQIAQNLIRSSCSTILLLLKKESIQKSVSTAHDLYNSAVRGSFDPAQKHEIIKRLARGQKTHVRHLKVKKSDHDTVF